MKPARNHRLASISGSVFAKLETTRRKVLAAGGEVVNLGIGSPDCPPNALIRRTLSDGVLRQDAYSYTVKGLSQLHQAAANWYQRRFGVEADPATQVADLMGSQDGWAHIFLGLVDPGDVVLVPDPTYPIYSAAPVLAGAEVHHVRLEPQNGFLPDLEAIPADVLNRARAVILNYPANPTTATADLQFFSAVVEWASKWGIWVLHDAAYSELAFDGYRPPSFLQVPGAAEVGLEFNSLSKTFNMAGARVGFAVGNPALIETLREVKGHVDYGTFLPVQEAAIVALQQPLEEGQAAAAVYQQRRDTLVAGLNSIGWRVEPPRATMFCWAPVPPGMGGSEEFAMALLEETGVMVVPGTGFGPGGEGFVRIALVQPDSVLIRAVELIGTRFRW